MCYQLQTYCLLLPFNNEVVNLCAFYANSLRSHIALFKASFHPSTTCTKVELLSSGHGLCARQESFGIAYFYIENPSDYLTTLQVHMFPETKKFIRLEQRHHCLVFRKITLGSAENIFFPNSAAI